MLSSSHKKTKIDKTRWKWKQMHILFIEIETNKSMHINQKFENNSSKFRFARVFHEKFHEKKRPNRRIHRKGRERKKLNTREMDREKVTRREREKVRKWERERMVNMKRIFESYGNCTLHDADVLTWEHI